MIKVILYLIGVWTLVIIIILAIATISPAMNDIAETSADAMASGNMTGIVGIEESVRSYPVWKWFLPVFFGIVASVVILIKNRDEVFKRR
jgi:hypothetical protein